jgi:hypothetical protein
MPIPLTCGCGRSFHLKDELAGKKIRCPECRRVLSVPAPAQDAAEDEVLEVPACRDAGGRGGTPPTISG